MPRPASSYASARAADMPASIIPFPQDIAQNPLRCLVHMDEPGGVVVTLHHPRERSQLIGVADLIRRHAPQDRSNLSPGQPLQRFPGVVVSESVPTVHANLPVLSCAPTMAHGGDRKSTRLNSSHYCAP